jgi:hypothetical protein
MLTMSAQRKKQLCLVMWLSMPRHGRRQRGMHEVSRSATRPRRAICFPHPPRLLHLCGLRLTWSCKILTTRHVSCQVLEFACHRSDSHKGKAKSTDLQRLIVLFRLMSVYIPALQDPTQRDNRPRPTPILMWLAHWRPFRQLKVAQYYVENAVYVIPNAKISSQCFISIQSPV